MANLKEIRSRISSISSTMQITSAMKMVSAAKLKKAQDAISAMRPYAEKLTYLLQKLSASLSEDSPYVARTEDPKRILIVAITSNRGLCGAFNSNIIKQTIELACETYKGKTVEVFAVGKKGGDILKKHVDLYQVNTSIFDKLTFADTSAIADQLMELYLSKKFDKIVLVYNHFKNAATQIVKQEEFLPIQPLKEDENSEIDYIFEPSKQEIIEKLIPQSLRMQFFKALRDSFASEHGARMTAMHKATDNAKDLQDQLKLTYNKARQASITNEILEIVAGAEALNG